MARIPLIAGNWKLHKTLEESRSLAKEITSNLDAKGSYSIGLFPTALALATVADEIAKAKAGSAGLAVSADVLVGAQNMHFEEAGAFTGENSATLIRAAGGNSVILGHSERRHVFGESDEWIGKKVVAALAAGIQPILCVGELLEERDAGSTHEVVGKQLSAGLENVGTADELSRVIIAYEPVWAIGTGRTATPEQAQDVHAFIRGELSRAFAARGAASDRSQETLILYGGSVKPGNAGELMSQTDIDGALVGGASLDAESFLGICNACP